MATQVLQDPRRYLLVVLVVALAGIVPLAYGFIQMMPFGTDAGLGAIVVWVLLGLAIAALVGGGLAGLGIWLRTRRRRGFSPLRRR